MYSIAIAAWLDPAPPDTIHGPPALKLSAISSLPHARCIESLDAIGRDVPHYLKQKFIQALIHLILPVV